MKQDKMKKIKFNLIESILFLIAMLMGLSVWKTWMGVIL